MKTRVTFFLCLLILGLLAACQSQDEAIEVPTLIPVNATMTSTPAEAAQLASPSSVTAATETPLPSPLATETEAPLPSLSPTLTETLPPTQTLPVPSDTPSPVLQPSETFTSTASPISPTEQAASSTPSPSPTFTTSPTLTYTFTPSPTFSATPGITKTLIPTYTPTDSYEAALGGQVGALVIAEALNIRNGPGDQFDIIAHLEQDSLVKILGTDSNQAWFFIEYGDGSRGWIYGGFVQVIGDLATAPNAEPTSLPERVFMGGQMTWMQQQFNNCAPTAVTMALTYYGGTQDQNVARSYLRPSFDQDVSVDIAQMVDYINETQAGLHSVWRMGGNWTIIRQLVAAGFPVIIETSVAVRDPEPGWAGHNRVIVGYEGGNILTYDSFLGHGNYQGYAIPEAELDEVWRHMNRHFMVIYPIEREAEVAYLMGEIWSVPRSLDRAHNIALAEMRANPQNVFAHFNLGATYTALGQYDLAAQEFDLAFEISKNVPVDEGIPFRIFWYQFSIFEAYYQTGRYNEVIDNARRALQNMGGNATEELYYWLALGYAGRGQIDRAREELQNAIDFNPGYDPAIQTLSDINAGTYRAPF